VHTAQANRLTALNRGESSKFPHRFAIPLRIDRYPMTATAHINCGGIRFDQLQLAIEGRSFLALGTSTFTLHNSFASFNAQVVGLADVRVKLTLSPTAEILKREII
jgi:hypothetical protein